MSIARPWRIMCAVSSRSEGASHGPSRRGDAKLQRGPLQTQVPRVLGASGMWALAKSLGEWSGPLHSLAGVGYCDVVHAELTVGINGLDRRREHSTRRLFWQRPSEHFAEDKLDAPIGVLPQRVVRIVDQLVVLRLGCAAVWKQVILAKVPQVVSGGGKLSGWLSCVNTCKRSPRTTRPCSE
eukprot:7387226-Prymnesium_polylepis.3